MVVVTIAAEAAIWPARGPGGSFGRWGQRVVGDRPLERRSAVKTATIATFVNLVAELRIILCIAIHLPVASAIVY